MNLRPETRARRLGGALIVRPVVTQMLRKNTLRGKSHLSFLLPRGANPITPRFRLGGRLALVFGGLGLRLAGRRRGRERHAQVGADDVDDGLAVFRSVLSEPFQCVQAAEPDRGLITAELLDRLGVQLGDPPLGRVTVGQIGGDLLVMLAAEGEHEPDSRPNAGAGRQPGADGIQPGVGLVGPRLGAAGDGQQPHRYRDSDDHDCGGCGKRPRPE